MTSGRRARGRRSSVAFVLLLAASVLGCATTGRSPRKPVLDTLTVTGLSVTAIPLEGANAAGRDWFQQLLAGQATAAATRAALERQLSLVLLSSSEAPEEVHRLSGSVSVPVALPPEYRGSRAAFQEGVLALAHLELSGQRGGAIATAEAEVGWSQVRWTTGGHKMRRARLSDLALLEAVELAVERAVRQLELQLSPAGESTP